MRIRKHQVLYKEVGNLGYTIEEFADKLGISGASFSNKLNGKTEFTLSEVKYILDFFESKGINYNFEYLFFGNKVVKTVMTA
jgi:transcriptional regulator with XRE-family HTH domain